MIRRVGNNSETYNDSRNINSLPFKRYRFKRVYDFFNVPNALTYRLFGKISNRLKFLHCDFGVEQADVLHFCNTISLSRTPWIVTLESAIPRWNHESHFGIGLLSGKSCKKLISISEATDKIQRHYISLYPQYEREILRKMCVIHPPQKLLIEDYTEKNLDRELIVFTMIGHDFFYKGGKEVMSVFSRLLKKDYPIRLNVISNLNYGDYASQATREDLLEVKNAVDQFPGRIIYHKQIPNEEVLSLLRTTHVGLLPSYADPYGYSVLEAQASGCPMVTTDIRAFPETNGSEFGWQIKVPKNELGYGLIQTASERRQFSQILETGLEETITEIVKHPETIKQKGMRSLERIRERHNPERIAREIEDIYDEALSN